MKKGASAENKRKVGIVQPIRLFDLLKQVISSWQVIFITVAIIIYLSLVFYVARLYHNRSFRSLSKPKKARRSKKAAPEQVQVATDDEENLGLEEGNI